MQEYHKSKLKLIAQTIHQLEIAKTMLSPEHAAFSLIDSALAEAQKGYDWHTRALNGLIPPDELGLDDDFE
jgi:hypothetical protein